MILERSVLMGLIRCRFARNGLYYSSGNNILNIPASGGASSTVLSAPSAITALYPPSTANGLLWGEVNGSTSGPRPAWNRDVRL